MSFSCLAMVDIGLTHMALRVLHRRDSETGPRVAWIGDGTRTFVVVLIETAVVDAPLRPTGHLAVGCATP